jgi:translocation and assembly module TamB
MDATARDGRRIAIEASGRDSGAGRIHGQGQVDLEGGPSFSGDFDLEDLHLVNLDLVSASTGGSLHVEGSGREGAISGSLAVRQTELDIGQALPPKIVTLDVVEVHKPAHEPSPPPPESADFRLALSIGADLGDIRLRGRGLDSEWKGELSVNGTASQPEVVGQLSLVRGSYDLFGRRLNLTRGTVQFDGERPPDPRIDLEAQGQTQDITAVVKVTGTATKPEFAFTSDPVVPKDEVLARLLFGRDPGQLSVLQQLSLARAAAGQLSGGELSGFDPLSKMRNLLGLDVLEAGGTTTGPMSIPGLPSLAGVGQGDAARTPVGGQQTSTTHNIGPSLSAGKYLSDRTFLRVDQGTTGGQVTVEVELGAGFSVETRVGESSGGGAGFSWKKDY